MPPIDRSKWYNLWGKPIVGIKPYKNPNNWPQFLDNYVLSYYPNGATGSAPSSAYSELGNPTIANKGNLTKTLRYVKNGSMTTESLSFLGWNSKADGTGVTYSPGSTITLFSNTQLYAMWQKPHTYTLTYDGNGNTSTNFESQGYGIPGYSTGNGIIEPVQIYAWDQETKIASGEIFRKQDPTYQHSYEFMEWNTKADGTGESFYDVQGAGYVAYNRDITLYATWTETRFLRFVTYMVGQNVQQAISNNIDYITVDGVYFEVIMWPGFAVKYSSLNTWPANVKFDITPVYNGNSIGVINRDFSRSGYTLLGWNTKQDGSGTFYPMNSYLYDQNRNLVVAEQDNMWGNVLYAVWGAQSTPLPNNPGGSGG